jgi:hypothetical protein
VTQFRSVSGLIPSCSPIRRPRTRRPRRYLLAGNDTEPVLVQVVEIDDDGRAHVRIVGAGPFLPADLNFEAEEPGTVWAPVPPTGAPATGAIVLAGTAAAWSWVSVEAVEDSWLLLRLQASTPRATNSASATAVRAGAVHHGRR